MSDDKPPVLKDAKENVWFRLATISRDRETNRRLWNGYMGWKLSDENKAYIRDRDGKPISFPELSDKEKKRIELHFYGEKLPDPNYVFTDLGRGVDFSYTRLPRGVDFSGFIFPHSSSFYFASFGRWANFNKAIFGDFVIFYGATFDDNVTFRETTFGFLAQFQHTQFKGAVYFTDEPSSSEDDRPQEQKSIFRAVSARLRGLGRALRPIKDSSAANTRPTSQLDFSNATFGGETRFTGRQFAEPPLFFEAKLHENTYWGCPR